MARILLGVSGGIAAYKAVEFTRLAMRAGHSVRVVMTEGATRFVGVATFEGVTGAPVLVSEFEADPMRGAFPGDPVPEHEPIGHLELAGNADAMIIAPASANTIAKLAGGFADSMLTTGFLACPTPRLVAPAMNNRMWADASTQANIETLRERGVIIIDPEEGELASRGEFGRGRLSAPENLLAEVEATLPHGNRPWDGLRVLVTAGGTREPIDPVRFVGNRSSGRMGFALAPAALRRGAEVTLIAANVSLPTPPGADRINVETTAELGEAVRDAFPTSLVLLMAAAPADFTPGHPSATKMKRAGQGIEIHLSPTEDILARTAKSRTDDQTIVGFAAEHGGDAETRAQEKLERKGADLIVLNDVSDKRIGFDSEENAVTLITASGSTHIDIASKDAIADAILGAVDSLRAPAKTTLG